MDKVAALNAQDRSDIFRETADQMNLPPAIIEKDFWVCWTLKYLFKHTTFGTNLIFKGGTTLSKIYNVIKRFSEDIDISISKALLGFDGARDPGNPDLSGTKRRKLLEDMSATCSNYVCTTIKQELELLFAPVIGEAKDTWTLKVYDEDPARQTLLFEYPSFEDRVDYIPPYVRIECGCRSDFWPTEQTVITPYCADYVPDVFEDPGCGVTVLTVGRTFWEKATILHQEYHRPKDKSLPSHYSRHYHDLAMLALSKYKTAALEDRELLAHVVEHKKYFFRCAWANYDEATHGTLRLSPPKYRIADLRTDYNMMNIMFFEKKPEFDKIMAVLADLETEINSVDF